MNVIPHPSWLWLLFVQYPTQATIWWTRSVRRHPKVWTLLSTFAALTLIFGAHTSTALAFYVPVLLVPWRLGHPPSFSRLVSGPWRCARRRRRYERKWSHIMHENGLTSRLPKALDAIPRIVRVRCREWGDEVLVEPLISQVARSYRERAEELADDLGARELRVFKHRVPHRWWHGPLKPPAGLLRLEFAYGPDPLAETIPALPIPKAEDVDLSAIPVGLTERGDPWTIDVRKHILLAGETRSGKSGILQGLIRGLMPLIESGEVVIYCFDPKGGMELKALEPLCAGYSDADPQGMSERLGDLVTMLNDRQARYGSSLIRKHVPSVAEPLVLIIIDELAELVDKRGKVSTLATTLHSQISAFLRRGAGVGFDVIGALQDPRAETNPLRRGFPTKIATRLDNRDEDEMILGKRAVLNGYLASEIPEDMQGVAYAKMHGHADPIRVRAAYVTDEDITEMVAEYTTKAPDLVEVG